MTKLKVLDLFSGIGGFSLGLERTGGFETVAFCEIDSFCQKVLKKHWPEVPIYNDVRTLEHDGPIDVITGGYPCQPFSTAGKRQGHADDRHLWPAMFSLVKKYRPAWVIGENVAGHISMGLDDVLADLESEAYTARAFVIPACAVDARHRRDRVWIVANAQSAGKRGEVGNIRETDGGQGGALFQQSYSPSESMADTMQQQNERNNAGGFQPQSSRSREDVAYPNSSDAQGFIEKRYDEENRQKPTKRPIGLFSGTRNYFEWEPEPNVGRVAHGVPNRVDRLRALGNAVVPQIPEIIGYAILESEKLK